MDQALFVAMFSWPLGLFLMTVGLLVYSGKFLAFRVGLNTVWTGEPTLAATYIGLFCILLPLQQMAMEQNLNEFLILGLSCQVLLSGFVGILGGFWMPRFLKPQFIKDENDERRRQRQAARVRRRDASRAARGPEAGGNGHTHERA